MTLLVRVSSGDVSSHHVCEIPVVGPGKANRLVIITGLANCSAGEGKGLDVDQDDIATTDVQITTEYRLGPDDEWLGSAAYVSLATVTADDLDFPGTPTGFIFALNEVTAQIDEQDGRSVVIHIDVALQGDSTLKQIAYQANGLLQKLG